MKKIRIIGLCLCSFIALMSFTINTHKPTYTLPYDEAMRLIGNVLTKARTFTGSRYKWGGTQANGLDCSALMVLSFRSVGITLPRTSSEIAHIGKRVSLKDIMPGDLVFFSTSPDRNISHIGIVAEFRSENDIRFIHSSSLNGGVREDNLFDKKYQKWFVKAMRVF